MRLFYAASGPANVIESGEELTNDYAAEVVDPPFYDLLCEQYGVNEDFLDGR